MAVNWKILLTRPIAFHAPLAHIAGSVSAGLMLSQAIYWTPRAKSKAGWFYKSAREWYEETTLSRREQETARKNLRDRGLIEEDLRGVPATVHYRVIEEAVETALALYARKVELSMAESAKLDSTKAPNQYGGNVEASMAESAQHLRQRLPETTQETTSSEIVPIHLWLSFIEMRKKLRKPLTDYAGELVRRELSKLKEQGHDPVEVIEQSIRNGWQDVFPIKGGRGNGTTRTDERSERSASAITRVLGSAKPLAGHLRPTLPPRNT